MTVRVHLADGSVESFVQADEATARKTADALMAAWNADLREIMEEIQAEYAKANHQP